MSVLFKALAKAAKAREPRRGDHGGGAGAAPSGPAKAGLGKRLRILLALGLAVLLFVGGFIFFGDDLFSMLDQVANDLASGPPLPPGNVQNGPVKRIERPQPAKNSSPQAVPPPVVTAIPADQQAPAAPAPVPAPAAAVELPGGNPAGAVPAASPPVAALLPSQSPVATTPPPGGVAAPVPVPAPAPPPAPAPEHPRIAAPKQAAAPHALKRGPVQPTPLPKEVAPGEEDLPALLDRIRRQHDAPVLADQVHVDRTRSVPNLTGADGNTAVNVAVTVPVDRETAGSAYELLMHGQYEGALSLYQKALKLAPANLSLLLGKATAEHKLGHLDQARDSYRQILAIDPENPEALTNMTAIVADQAPEQALLELRALQKSHPGFSPIGAQIANIEAANSNVSAAISALNNAIAQSPDNGLYRLNLAILQDRAGMASEAAASYQAAITMLGSSEGLPIPLEQIRRRLRYLQGR
ncbi:MAG TPA: tetratricopeptide repeat protein [Rhodospirillaceae bacterium]|nr:tetratricopeptide repeat protein [Rhodospirillaceae bacterium]